jgi:hypothetical protein
MNHKQAPATADHGADKRSAGVSRRGHDVAKVRKSDLEPPRVPTAI